MLKIFILLILLMPNLVLAKDLYVSKTGDDSVTYAANDISHPWLTVQKAASTVARGDTVYIRSGTYTEQVNIATAAGSSESDRITFINYPGESVTIDGTGLALGTYGTLLDMNTNYLTVDGLTIANGGQGGGSGQNAVQILKSNTILQNCTIYNNNLSLSIYVFSYSGNITNIQILNNTISNYYQWAILISGYLTYYPSYILIQGNTIHDGGATGNVDAIQIGSQDGGCEHVIVKNNTLYNHNGGDAFIDTGGKPDHSDYILIEDNTIYKGTGVSTSVKFNPKDKGIFRRNNITDCRFDIYQPTSAFGMRKARVYHNTFVVSGVVEYIVYWNVDTNYDTDFGGWYWKNNVFSNKNPYLESHYGEVNPLHTDSIYFNGNYFHTTSASANWRWYDLGGSVWEAYGWGASTAKFAEWQSDFSSTVSSNTLDKTSPLTTLFINPTSRNYNLAVNSPIIDKGVNLTTVSSATGSGTTFTVVDARYFCDGWNLITGDTIMIGSQTRTITAVDYDTNTITVSSSLAWTNGDGVNLAFNGSAPDPGAYEYALPANPTAARAITRIFKSINSFLLRIRGGIRIKY